MKPGRTGIPVEQADRSRRTSISSQLLTCEMQCSLHQVFPSHLFFQLLVLFSQKFNVLHMEDFTCHYKKTTKNQDRLNKSFLWESKAHLSSRGFASYQLELT